MIEALLGRQRTRAAGTDHRGLSGLSEIERRASGSAATSPSARRRGRSPKRTAGMRRPIVYRYDYAPRTFSWSGLRRHARHRAVRRVRRLPQSVRIAAHRCGRPAVRPAGQRRRADPLAGVQPDRCAGRRLARVHRRRPRRHGVRSPAPHRVRPARRSAAARGKASRSRRADPVIRTACADSPM